ncbi:MAG TPA: protein-glutamate O-methyltransferase CheR [Bryobacteraceae bacterium]
MSTLAPPANPGAIEPENYRYLQELVYTGSGIILEEDKHYLLEARLSSVARNSGLPSINDLCNLLRATSGDDGVRKQVVEAMTTNETYFFREPAQYDAIKNVLLKELRELRSATRKLSFWSAASSTGQEAYTLGMLLNEQGFGDWNTQILGTDLNHRMVERARAGRYLQIEVNRGLPAPYMLKYFTRQGVDWQINEQIRKTARFEQFDLRHKMRAYGPFDLVFIRNVLVYFDAPTRRQILREIHSTLFRGGWLLLGSAEVPSGLDDCFERLPIGNCTAYVAR